MKLAIVGKGGVGKTTLTAALCQMAGPSNDQPVIVVDADPDGNLASALGVPPSGPAPRPLIAQMQDP